MASESIGCGDRATPMQGILEYSSSSRRRRAEEEEGQGVGGGRCAAVHALTYAPKSASRNRPFGLCWLQSMKADRDWKVWPLAPSTNDHLRSFAQ